MSDYSKEEIENMVKEWIDNPENDTKKGIETLYASPFINYRGKTRDTQDYYTEVIAEYLLKNDNLTKLKEMQKITRNSTYNVEGHDGLYDDSTDRIEEHMAMDMFIQCKDNEKKLFEGIGKILDYQVPLKDKKTDKIGKIDILSVNDNTMYIIELKIPGSKETMLRCILESFTYLQRVDEDKLKKDFNLENIETVKAAPLVCFEGFQWKELTEDRPHLKKLIQELKIEGPFYYTFSNIKYDIKQ